MSVVIEGNTVETGMKVSFHTHNQYDQVLWTGYIVGICNYDMAKMIYDVDKIHHEVKMSPGQSGQPDLAGQQFIIFSTEAVEGKKIAFAVSWILDFTPIDTNNNLTIEVLDIPSAKVAELMTLLADNRFNARIV